MARAHWAAGHEHGAELWRSPARSLGGSAPERGGASEAGSPDARGALGRPGQSPRSRTPPPTAREGLGPRARQEAEPRGAGSRAPRAGSQGNVAASERIPRPRRLLRAERKRWTGGGAWLRAPKSPAGEEAGALRPRARVGGGRPVRCAHRAPGRGVRTLQASVDPESFCRFPLRAQASAPLKVRWLCRRAGKRGGGEPR